MTTIYKYGLAAITITLGSPMAFASFFQNYCGDAQGTIKTANGHRENYIILTERTLDEEENVIDSNVKYTRRDVALAESMATEVSSSKTKTCAETGGSGAVYWNNIYAKKIHVRKIDGSDFSKNTVGVSEDLKEVSGFVICDYNGNSRTFCEKPEK